MPPFRPHGKSPGAREGADVAVNYRKQAAAAEEVAAEIRALGRRAAVVQADISDAEACLRMAREAEGARVAPEPLIITACAGGSFTAARPSGRGSLWGPGAVAIRVW